MTKKKILLVDDEVTLTRLIKLNLEKMGPYEVAVENKGSQALTAARTFGPDLIFLDIVMPDLEGSEVARQMREDRALKDVPIVFLTATITREEIGSNGGVVGGEIFLPKPASTQQLIDCIEKYTKQA